MPIERLSLRMRVALLGFAAVLLAGALAAFLMLSELQRRTDADALAGRQAMAESVAQTLAAQIARAVRVGIPLEQLPGVQEYFRHTLERTPDIASIALQMPDGRQLHAVGQPQPQAMQTTAIVVQGQAIAQVRPYAVDVSGGVEQAKGMKDAAKIEAFMQAVRQA